MTEAGGAALARRIAANTAVQVAGKAVVLGVGAASVAVTTRYLGVAGYGRFALALAFVQMLGVLADAGLLNVTVREIGREPRRAAEVVGNALAMRLVLGLAVVALAAGLSRALPYAPQVRVAILIATAPFVLGLVTTSLVAIFQARLDMGRVVLADVAGRCAAFAALLVVVSADLGFYAVVWSAAAGAAVALALTATFVLRSVRVRLRVDRAVWRELAVAALPLGVTLAVTEIYFRADTVILSLSRPDAEVGEYTLCYRIFELLAVFPAIVMSSVFPVLSRALRESRPLAERTLDATAQLFTTLGLPVAAGGLLLAPQLLGVAAGDEFAGAATALRLLLCGALLAALSGLLGYALIAADRQRSVLWLSVAALALNVALNAGLVPSLGVDAAAAIALGSDALLLAGGWWLVRRELGIAVRPRLAWRAAVATAAMAGALWPLRHATLAAALPAGIAVYGAALWAVGGIDRRMIEALRP